MKKTLILGVICTLVNFASIAHSYPIKYIAESSSTETSGSTGATGESGGSQSGSAGSGTTGGSSTPNSNGDVDKVESANPEVELDGAIGPWESGKDGMPNFENIESGDLIGEKPSEENLFKISVTVPLNMNFVIVNENENGSSPFGKFVSPYHSIYYRSDLWETPKSEGIETDVVSNFSLILSFSTQNKNSGTGNGAGGSAGTGSEGNASSTPSSGNITSGGSTGSNENIEPSGN